MNIACISAANIEVARDHSASVRACELVRDLLLGERLDARVEIIPLIDYEMKSCRMCGKCLETSHRAAADRIAMRRCVRDVAFNQVFEKLIAADGVFFVVPHYAPLPSKLMILFEKMEEIAFLSWCVDSTYRFPLAQKPAGVIAHGGQPASAETMAYYRRMLVEPVAAALGSVSMRVIGAGDDAPSGVTFGIRSIAKRDDSIFVDIQHDWDDVRRRIAPLVHNLAAAVTLPS